MATSLPPVRIAVRPSEGPADHRVIIDLRDVSSVVRAPSTEYTSNWEPPPPSNPVPHQPPTPPQQRREQSGPPSPKRFVAGETIPIGIQRMTVGLLDQAIGRLTQPGQPGDAEVHAARKAMRRTRALLRLTRDGLGRVYRIENGVLRDTARLLSDVRSSAVASHALDQLTSQFGPLLIDGLYVDLAEQLDQRHRRVAAKTLENRLLLAGVTANLRHARSRFAAYPTSPGSNMGYHGPLLSNDSSLFVRGIRRTYGRGRESMQAAAAQPMPDQLHEWRKRVRYLRYQMEALCPAWPEVMKGLCAALDELSETLGHERDQWELGETVRREPDLCPDAQARELLSALTLESRQSLREQSFRLGTKIYAELPNRFAARIQAYWDAWETPAWPMPS